MYRYKCRAYLWINYWLLNKNCQEITDECICKYKSSIIYFMKKFNIPLTNKIIKKKADINRSMILKKYANTLEGKKHLKEIGKETQFKKGYDSRRMGKRNWKPESLKNIGRHTKNRLRCNGHPNWKGGITSEHQRIRNSPKYKKWRLEVYKRDHYCCQICGVHCTSHTIVAHHKKNFSNYPDLRLDIDNGITYCRKCHVKIHS